MDVLTLESDLKCLCLFVYCMFARMQVAADVQFGTSTASKIVTIGEHISLLNKIQFSTEFAHLETPVLKELSLSNTKCTIFGIQFINVNKQFLTA